MRYVNHRRLAGAVLALGALAFPAAASAHPGVFEVDAKIAPNPNPTPGNYANYTTEHQYAVVNDGITQVWREVNAHPAGNGVVNYKPLPTAFRNTIPKSQWITGPYNTSTNLQIHATCGGVTALDDLPNILSWQTDPFYNYIPWQKESANFGDDPSKWIPIVKTLTGVDLATVASPKTACEGLGGTYYAADTVVNNATSVSSATIADAVKTVKDPLDAQVAGLAAQIGPLQDRVGFLDGTVNNLTIQKNASDATATSLRNLLAEARTGLTVKVLTTSKRGATVDVTGPPLAAVTVQLLTTTSKAKSLGLPSTLLGSKTTTLDATGKRRIAVAISSAAAKAIKANPGSVPVSVVAISAAKSKAASMTLKP